MISRTMGRLAEVKGFEYLIDALPSIENATAVVIGDGEPTGQRCAAIGVENSHIGSGL